MAATIEIDDEALRRLDELRRPAETYSGVICRCLPPRREFEEILEALCDGPGEAVLNAAEESLVRRRERPFETRT